MYDIYSWQACKYYLLFSYLFPFWLFRYEWKIWECLHCSAWSRKEGESHKCFVVWKCRWLSDGPASDLPTTHHIVAGKAVSYAEWYVNSNIESHLQVSGSNSKPQVPWAMELHVENDRNCLLSVWESCAVVLTQLPFNESTSLELRVTSVQPLLKKKTN